MEHRRLSKERVSNMRLASESPFVHSGPRMEGYLLQKTVFGKKRVWCVADGIVVDVYRNRLDSRPKVRLETLDVWFGSDMRTLRVKDVVLFAETEEEFESWACCLTELKPHVSFELHQSSTHILSHNLAQFVRQHFCELFLMVCASVCVSVVFFRDRGLKGTTEGERRSGLGHFPR